MVIKDKFRFTSFILFILMFIVIIFLSIKAYGSSDSIESETRNLRVGDYISDISLSENSSDDVLSDDEEYIYVNYKQVQTTEGQSLWDIAKRYHTKGDIRKYVRHLAVINDLNEGTLTENKVLMVPISD